LSGSSGAGKAQGLKRRLEIEKSAKGALKKAPFLNLTKNIGYSIINTLKNSLTHKDLYPSYANVKLYEDLAEAYDKTGRQLCRLRESRSNFKRTT
jgi:hypothetical protein